jgi:hypothetical protein
MKSVVYGPPQHLLSHLLANRHGCYRALSYSKRDHMFLIIPTRLGFSTYAATTLTSQWCSLGTCSPQVAVQLSGDFRRQVEERCSSSRYNLVEIARNPSHLHHLHGLFIVFCIKILLCQNSTTLLI